MVDTLDRRKSVRANAVITVEIKDGAGFSLHPTHDLSSNGLFFDRAIPHAVGERVELSFQLPGESQVIRCQGEVANVPDAKGYGMGVRFIDLSAGDRVRLEAFIIELRANS